MVSVPSFQLCRFSAMCFPNFVHDLHMAWRHDFFPLGNKKATSIHLFKISLSLQWGFVETAER